MIAEPIYDETAIQATETEGSAIEIYARDLSIDSDADHRAACALEREWAAKEQAAKDLVGPAVQANHRAWKESLSLQDKLVGAFIRARQTLKGKIGSFRLAEGKRAAAEAVHNRDAARRQSEEETLARAQRAQDQGQPEKAEAILNRPAPIAVSIPPRPVEKAGVSVREVWSAEIEDVDALIRWCCENLEHRRQFLLPAMPALNSQARSLKATLNTTPGPIPGIRAVSKFA